MRRTLIALLLTVAAPAAFAQQPPKLEPLPEPPPMPAGDAALEPDVTIVKRGEDTVQEYRIRGKLYMLKVTPPHGTPYYLIDQEGHGVMTRQDVLPTLAVPMWVVKSW